MTGERAKRLLRARKRPRRRVKWRVKAPPGQRRRGTLRFALPEGPWRPRTLRVMRASGSCGRVGRGVRTSCPHEQPIHPRRAFASRGRNVRAPRWDAVGRSLLPLARPASRVRLTRPGTRNSEPGTPARLSTSQLPHPRVHTPCPGCPPRAARWCWCCGRCPAARPPSGCSGRPVRPIRPGAAGHRRVA